MNPSEQEIEQALRAAPKPAAPAGLKGKLAAQVNLPRAKDTPAMTQAWSGPGTWLSRWWPALVPATVSLVCAMALAAQQAEIRDLKQTLEKLYQPHLGPIAAAAEGQATAENALPPADGSGGEERELARLRETAARLTEEVAQLERMREENGKLRAELARPVAGEVSPEDAEALAKARENAMAVACVNNLKQLGLSVKVWSIDNSNIFPNQVLEMTNEMSTPKILVCPADTGRQAAPDWASWTAANMSYEFLAPGAADDEPQRVLFRCPIHGSVCLCDGSVQKGLWKTYPERFVQRNGKLYYDDSAAVQQNPPPTPQTGQAPNQ